MTNTGLRTRFQATVLGLAVGDALGRPTEFLDSLEDIRDKFGPHGVTDFEPDWHPAGTYTDDTQMALAVARALIQSGHQPLETLMNAMAHEFIKWNRSPENNRAPGVTCRTGCEQLEAGVHWRHAGVADSKGCGSAMRTAPIGLYYHDDQPRLIEVARTSSLLTHGHPTALAAAAAAALPVAWALHGDDPRAYPARLIEALHSLPDSQEITHLIARVPQVLASPPDEVLHPAALGAAWTGEEAVASALYCFCRTPNDYRNTVLTAANTVGDSDSIACIAGAISGAYNDLDAIPEPWRQQVENTDMLHETAESLFEASQRPRH
jgi:ADP-ribosylglycohydrolase